MNVCRLCLQGDSPLRSIVDPGLRLTLHKITQIVLNSTDGYPQAVCVICLTYLKKCHKLIKMSSRSEVLLEVISRNKLTSISVDSVCAMSNRVCMLVVTEPQVVSFESTNAQDIPVKVECDKMVESFKENDLESKSAEFKPSVVQFKKETEDTRALNEEKCFVEMAVTKIEEGNEQVSHNELQQQTPTPASVIENCIEVGASVNSKEVDEGFVPIMSNVDLIDKLHKGCPCSKTLCNKCNESDEPFALVAKLNIHSRMHTGEKQYTCEFCNKTFNNTSNFKRHIRFHTEEKTFNCNQCEKKYMTEKELERHMKSHTGEKPYKCDVCHKRFYENQTLKIHTRIHTGEKPYKCDVCHRSFNQTAGFRRHMLCHTGERTFTCDVCGKSFCDRGALKIHMRTHTGEKPYSCEVCKKRFNNDSNLKKHKKVHTGEKPYKCDVCERKFGDINSCKVHIRTHTGEKPFRCDICDRRFVRGDYLKKHMNTHKS